MEKKILLSVILFQILILSILSQNVNSNFWEATDALGRKLSRFDEKQKDKTVILFYWTWHNNPDPANSEVKNISQILRSYPEAATDASHFAWHKNRYRNDFYWEEPLFNYYLTTDTWVLRKHAEMLADAGVDAVFFDCTNGTFTWDESTDSLLSTWDKAQREGVKCPKIGFLLPFGPNENSRVSLHHLYEKYYSKSKYQNLWFYWKNKPCIMAYPQCLGQDALDKEIRQFFTFRPGQPDYMDGPSKRFKNQWGWLENYPQHGYVMQKNGKYELVTVGVSQNASPETNGHCSAFNLPGSHSRSYTLRHGFDTRPNSYLYGANFDEQWDRAYELDPDAVFVTGWNEWIAGMWFEKDGWTGKPFSFVDEFDWDRSRDIEPVKSWGDYGDVYYLQLVDKIRRFKGTQPQFPPSSSRTIRMGDWSAWETVLPYFASYRGNTVHRHAMGRGNQIYENQSGRNDLVGAKVNRDKKYLYFYVETTQQITPSTDKNWMMLFIDIDRSKQTGWNGYDFVVNYKSPSNATAYVQHCPSSKWQWQEVGTANLLVEGNRLMLRIPRKLLGVRGKNLDFEFKWSDNMQEEGNIMDFYVNGDVAPGGRFNYLYKE